MALAWLMNLGFAAGGVPQPAAGGGGHRRRGSIWEPRVELAILAAEQERLLADLAGQEEVLREKAAPAAPMPLTSKQKRSIASAFLHLGKQKTQVRAVLTDVNRQIAELDEVERLAAEAARAIQEARAAEGARLADIEQRAAAAQVERAARVALQIEQKAQAVAYAERVRELEARALVARVEAFKRQQLDEAAAALVLWLTSD